MGTIFVVFGMTQPGIEPTTFSSWVRNRVRNRKRLSREGCAQSASAADKSHNHGEDLQRCWAAGSGPCVRYYFGGHGVMTAEERMAVSQRHLAVHE